MDRKKFHGFSPDKVKLVSDVPPALRLRWAREAKGLTQTELAKKVHTLYQRIHEWESSWKVPSNKYYLKLAEALDVDPEWLKEGKLDNSPRFLYESFSLDQEKLTDEEFKFRNHLVKDCAGSLSGMDYQTLLKLSEVLSAVLHADRILNDPEFREKCQEAVKNEDYYDPSVNAKGILVEIQNMIEEASAEVKKQ